VTPFVHPLRVRYGECDPQGIVFNANYVAYFDVVLTELWRAAFGSYSAMTDRGIDMVVGEVNARFHGSARFDDELELRLSVARLGTTAMTCEIDVVRDDDVLVAGTIRHVFVDVETWRKTAIPDDVRVALEPWVASGRP
jgi:acyl-CoA thioester hydrolase